MQRSNYIKYSQLQEISQAKQPLALNLQFFAKDGPGGEKTEPATGKKLDDMRKEGQVAKSRDLIMAISLLALFIMLKIYVTRMGTSFIAAFKDLYGVMGKVVDTSSEGLPIRIGLGLLREAGLKGLIIVFPIFIIAVLIAVLGNMLQQKWMVTTKPLAPKFSKLSPLNGFKRIFSVRQLFELLKSIAMLIIIGLVVYNSIKDKYTLLYTFYNVTLYDALGIIGDVVLGVGIKTAAVYLLVGFVDLIYQKFKFRNDSMMTKQEVKDEYKNTEGDPQVKGKIKQRMAEVSRRRMMEKLPEADVVITNPTHFAVALSYKPDQGTAPLVIAKGADYLCYAIKEKARELDIAIVEDKPLARILYHNVDIGTEIPQELYQAVAEILARVLAA